jgi:hypothetical protein
MLLENTFRGQSARLFDLIECCALQLTFYQEKLAQTRVTLTCALCGVRTARRFTQVDGTLLGWSGIITGYMMRLRSARVLTINHAI